MNQKIKSLESLFNSYYIPHMSHWNMFSVSTAHNQLLPESVEANECLLFSLKHITQFPPLFFFLHWVIHWKSNASHGGCLYITCEWPNENKRLQFSIPYFLVVNINELYGLASRGTPSFLVYESHLNQLRLAFSQ